MHPYRCIPAFDKIVAQADDMGIIKHLLARETPQHIIDAAMAVGTDEEEINPAPSQLKMGAFFGHYFILAVGLSGAVLWFIFKELSWKAV